MTRVPLNDLGRGKPDAAMTTAMMRVANSGWYVHGPEHEAFEAELGTYLGVSHCHGVASGTDALEIALRAVTASRRGAVLTAANAGGYTTVAALAAGLDVRLADVDPATLCLDPASVSANLEGVAAVVVTHLYGRLGPMEEVMAICRAAGVAVVEDCAQSIGARRDGVRAGGFGDVATFSFYPTKNLGALGDGGAVVTSSNELSQRVLALRQYGWSSKYVIGSKGGRNSRLDELQAAVLRINLQSLDAGNERRRSIIAAYREASVDTPVEVLAAAGEDHVAHLAIARTLNRDMVREHLTAAGVATDIHYPLPDHRQPAYAEMFGNVELPVTEAAAATIFTLPCFPQLTDAEVHHVSEALRSLRTAC